MPAFAALLRGVNVGRGHRVAMADLRALLASLGYLRVATLLNSGNVAFTDDEETASVHATRIAEALADRLGLHVPVVVLSAADLDRVVAENEIAPEVVNASRLLVVLVQEPSTLAALAGIAELAAPPERFVVGSRAAYLHCPDGILASRAGAALLDRTRVPLTTRNWATVRKLHALVNDR